MVRKQITKTSKNIFFVATLVIQRSYCLCSTVPYSTYFFLFFFSLLSSLSDRHQQVSDEINSLDNVDRTAAALADKLKRLQRDIAQADAWDRDSDKATETLKVQYNALKNEASRKVSEKVVSPHWQMEVFNQEKCPHFYENSLFEPSNVLYSTSLERKKRKVFLLLYLIPVCK